MNVSNAGTIEDFIRLGESQSITHSSLYFKTIIEYNKKEMVIFNHEFILIKYMEYLKPYMEMVELSDNEHIKYKFKPKLLSLDLYETPDLWGALLYINNMISVVEFTKKKIMVFTKDISIAIEEILVMEEDRMNTHNEELGKMMKKETGV